MRLVNYQRKDKQRLGIWLDPYIVDVQDACALMPELLLEGRQNTACFDSIFSLLQAGDEDWAALERVAAQIARLKPGSQEIKFAQSILFPKEEVRLMAPLLTPGKVICVAGNFPSPGKANKPDYPTLFLKPSSSITGPGDSIRVSELTCSVAYEVELAVVIGRRARHVSPEDALAYVRGYTLANDVGDRLLEKRTSQWTSGKMFDSFTPLGPWLVTKDEIPQPIELNMTTLVNGQTVQKGNTGEMFFDVPALISILSDLTTLYPGDIILTGSPKLMAGQPNPVVALTPGDSVTIKIDGLGELTNGVEKELE